MGGHLQPTIFDWINGDSLKELLVFYVLLEN